METVKEPEDFDADTARELLNQHTHEPDEEEVEWIADLPRPQREKCTRSELEEIAADITAQPLERQAAREALKRGDFLP
jgi:hypothetical protein